MAGKPNFVDYSEAEWRDFSIAFSGANMGGVRGVRYGVEGDKEHLHAQGFKAIGIQSGNEKPSGEFKILKNNWDAVYAAAIAAGADGPLDVEFDLICKYKTKGTRPVQTDVLIRCQLTKWEKGWDQGAKFMELTLPFLALEIKSS